MKIGIALDGPLCDTEALKQEWLRVQGDSTFLSDTAFYGALRAYDDAGNALRALAVNHDLYVLTERPKAVFLTTRAWIRNNIGLTLDKDRLIMQALKRYDCRLNGIEVFIDSDQNALENLKVETVQPIRGYLVDRERNASLMDVVREIDESICFGY